MHRPKNASKSNGRTLLCPAGVVLFMKEIGADIGTELKPKCECYGRKCREHTQYSVSPRAESGGLILPRLGELFPHISCLVYHPVDHIGLF